MHYTTDILVKNTCSSILSTSNNVINQSKTLPRSSLQPPHLEVSELGPPERFAGGLRGGHLQSSTEHCRTIKNTQTSSRVQSRPPGPRLQPGGQLQLWDPGLLLHPCEHPPGLHLHITASVQRTSPLLRLHSFRSPQVFPSGRIWTENYQH